MHVSVPALDSANGEKRIRDLFSQSEILASYFGGQGFGGRNEQNG